MPAVVKKAKADVVKEAVNKAVSKGTKKAGAKAESNGKAEKSGLRKPQVRILQALKSGKAMTRAEIAEKAPADLAMLNSYIGSNNEEVRAKNDKKVMPSLLTLKLVKFGAPEDGGGVVYEITAAGRKALEG